jgi:hypothetical protein
MLYYLETFFEVLIETHLKGLHDIIYTLFDLDWIIILFVIYLDPFRVEKIGGINLQGHFSGRSQFGKLGSGTFRGHFEASNDIFWG